MGLFEHLSELPSPCYVVDEKLLRQNLTLLKSIQDRTGCRILLAQKAFSMYSLYPLIGEYLCGTTASSLHEARLGHEEMGGETHIFSAAYRDDEMADILAICDHIVFNSFSQWLHFLRYPHQSRLLYPRSRHLRPLLTRQPSRRHLGEF